MALNLVITDAGLAEVINAEHSGTAPVKLASVGFGSGKYTATASQTAMRSRFKTLSTVAGGAVGDNVIHLAVTDDGSDEYDCFEVGVYTESGTLFGIVSSSAAIIQKARQAQAMLAIDFVLTGANPQSIVVGDITVTVAPATTERQGIAELATSAETISGTDATRVVTPFGLASLTATDARRGLAEFATAAETIAGSDGSRAVTPYGLSQLTATTERRGLAELATSAETIAGIDATRVVTPAGLASLTATDARRGLAEFATASETIAGSDGSRAVTPYGLSQVTATESRRGLVELADNSEYLQGSDTSRAVTPKQVRDDIKGHISTVASFSRSGHIKIGKGLDIDATGLVDIPAGLEFNFYGQYAPDGFLVADGSAISRTLYAKLFGVIGTTWGAGDGKTTFNLPNRLLYPYSRGVAIGYAGTKFESGLPNILGTLTKESPYDVAYHLGGDWFYPTPYGALYAESYLTGKQIREVDVEGGRSLGVLGFDASRYNKIYGRGINGGVTPPSVGVIPLIKY